MLLAENRVPFGAIYVPEKDFENHNSQVWFIATQLRYYLARVTIAPFEVKVCDGEKGICIELEKTKGGIRKATAAFKYLCESGEIFLITFF